MEKKPRKPSGRNIIISNSIISTNKITRKSKPKKGLFLRKKRPLPKRIDWLNDELTEEQKKENEEFLKQREGESYKRYMCRTRHRREKNEYDIELEKKLQEKKQKYLEKKKEQKKKYHSNFKLMFSCDKKYNHQKYFTFLIRYYSIKHNIREDDLRLLLFLYDNKPLTKQGFNDAVIMNFGKTNGQFQRFLSNGYIMEHKIKQLQNNGSVKEVPTGLYTVIKQICKVIFHLYELNEEMIALDHEAIEYDLVPQKVQVMINKMKSDMKYIRIGKIEPDKIIKI